MGSEYGLMYMNMSNCASILDMHEFVEIIQILANVSQYV